MNTESKELLDLLQKVRSYSKKDAMVFMRGLGRETQRSLLIGLRKAYQDDCIQGAPPLAASVPVRPEKPLEAPVRAKKVPYSLLLPPAMLEGLKALSDQDDSSVSHHIRQAIRAYLKGVRLK